MENSWLFMGVKFKPRPSPTRYISVKQLSLFKSRFPQMLHKVIIHFLLLYLVIFLVSNQMVTHVKHPKYLIIPWSFFVTIQQRNTWIIFNIYSPHSIKSSYHYYSNSIIAFLKWHQCKIIIPKSLHCISYSLALSNFPLSMLF